MDVASSKLPRALALLVITTAAAVPATAHAGERFDHRGSVGLLLGGGLEYKEAVARNRSHDGGLRYPLEVGGTLAVDYDGDELMLLARASLGPTLDTALIGGYRGYFGWERTRSFFDLGLAVHATPFFDIGPRVGFGFQYELLPVLGVYACAAAQLGGGNGFRFSAEATVGLQFRSYLLE